ncbi:nuclear transport factor 2 family protein [Leifsonia sp. NPDC058230]|uniref:nuclear transport factor 2 family protein n=1 Tax=Leifsonia sp. NPDC058230 TaxID=3346391 RepID=UPI0036DC385C
MTNSTNTRTTMQRYLDALLSGDLPTIADSFAEDATWTIHGTLPLSGEYRGRSAIMKFLISAGSLYSAGTQRFELGDLVVENDVAVLEWTVTGIGTATGSAYDNAYCGVFVIEYGRIAKVREYFDTQHVALTLYENATARE